jgi:hypothetical protein
MKTRKRPKAFWFRAFVISWLDFSCSRGVFLGFAVDLERRTKQKGTTMRDAPLPHWSGSPSIHGALP